MLNYKLKWQAKKPQLNHNTLNLLSTLFEPFLMYKQDRCCGSYLQDWGWGGSAVHIEEAYIHYAEILPIRTVILKLRLLSHPLNIPTHKR